MAMPSGDERDASGEREPLPTVRRFSTGAPFEPTDNQLRFLEAACDPAVKSSVTAWAEASGLHRTSFYVWCQREPGFLSWFKREHEARVRNALAQVHSTMLYKACDLTRENAGITRMLLERFDPGYKQKAQVEQTAITFILPEGAEVGNPKKDLIAAVMEVEGTLKLGPGQKPPSETKETK